MPDADACPACGTEIAPNLLTCPGCSRLVHADRLKEVSDDARQAETAGDLRGALIAWREALELLPPLSRQHQSITARVAELGQRVDATPLAVPSSREAKAKPPESGAWGGKTGAAGLGAIGLAIWKFKFLAVFALTKAKFLLLGLTKASTFLSMALSLGVYWAAFGWWFALGMVLSIYVHEMGHVYALTRYGVKASAPLFIPGVGAVIRLKQALADPRQDARVGLAGPLWGLGAALAAYGMSIALESPACAAIARFGAWVNLFNLLPLWQLDGGRAFRSLSRSERWFAAMAIAAVWSVSEEPLLIFLLMGATFRALTEAPPKSSDRGTLALYVALVAILSTMTLIPVALP